MSAPLVCPLGSGGFGGVIAQTLRLRRARATVLDAPVLRRIGDFDT